jgi:hypothetical protein
MAEKVLSFLKRTHPRERDADFDPRILRHVFDVYKLQSTQPPLENELSSTYFKAAIDFDIDRYGANDILYDADPTDVLTKQLQLLESEKMLFANYFAGSLGPLVIGELVEYEVAWRVFASTATYLIAAVAGP